MSLALIVLSTISNASSILQTAFHIALIYLVSEDYLTQPKEEKSVNFYIKQQYCKTLLYERVR